MGAGESSEVGCATCGEKLPPSSPKYDIVKACEHTKKLRTHCFWTPSEDELTVTKFLIVSVDGQGSKNMEGDAVTIKKGSKLIRYFRNVGRKEFFCGGCWVAQDTLRAANVLLEVAAKGTVVSKDNEIVKIGRV